MRIPRYLVIIDRELVGGLDNLEEYEKQGLISYPADTRKIVYDTKTHKIVKRHNCPALGCGNGWEKIHFNFLEKWEGLSKAVKESGILVIEPQTIKATNKKLAELRDKIIGCIVEFELDTGLIVNDIEVDSGEWIRIDYYDGIDKIDCYSGSREIEVKIDWDKMIKQERIE